MHYHEVMATFLYLGSSLVIRERAGNALVKSHEGFDSTFPMVVQFRHGFDFQQPNGREATGRQNLLEWQTIWYTQW